MKHVRDPLPDVQALRPDASAALAAIIERATAKETRNRYATAADMVTDLEQALAIEAARAGGMTNGEATSVLSALPPGTGGISRPPRHWVRWALALLVVLAASAAAYFTLRPDTATKKAPAAVAAAPLRAAAIAGAKDFDPFGGGQEHSYEVRNVFDADPSTTWSTESYSSGDLGKPGVGIYVWTSTPVKGRRVEVLTPTAGFSASVYGSNSVPTGLQGWGKPLARLKGSGSKLRATLPGASPFSHYLIWIDKLPPQRDSVSISTIRVLG
jgi:serine/threonine-protein kinase